MNIAVRQLSGNRQIVEKSCAVEILDATGRLVAVASHREDGSVKIATPGDPDFNAYSRIHKLAPSRVVVHEPIPDAITR